MCKSHADAAQNATIVQDGMRHSDNNKNAEEAIKKSDTCKIALVQTGL